MHGERNICGSQLIKEDVTMCHDLFSTINYIKIAWRNVNNLRYADDTTLMAENEEKLKSLLMKVERRE